MSNYIMRLDDASDHMDIGKWQRMESLLDRFEIKPIFGIIPENRDESLVSRYEGESSLLAKEVCVNGWKKDGHQQCTVTNIAMSLKKAG